MAKRRKLIHPDDKGMRSVKDNCDYNPVPLSLGEKSAAESCTGVIIGLAALFAINIY